MKHVFRSARYGGDQPPAVLFGQAFGVPIGVCSLPIMIAALVTMLQGGYPLPYLLYGFPASMVVAWWWTASRLRSEVAELILNGSLASVHSQWDVVTKRFPPAGSAILDVRRVRHDLHLTIGHETFVLRRSRWPDLHEIEAACRAAQQIHVDRVRGILEPSRRP